VPVIPQNRRGAISQMVRQAKADAEKMLKAWNRRAAIASNKVRQYAKRVLLLGRKIESLAASPVGNNSAATRSFDLS
jgi:hypothetical protein